MNANLEAFSRTVAIVHSASTDPSKWTEVVGSVNSLVSASMGGILEFEDVSGRLVRVTGLGHDPGSEREYVEHYCNIDPGLRVAMSVPACKPSTVYELIPAATRRKHEYFEYTRKFEIGDSLAVFTKTIHRRRILLALQRRPEADAFNDESKKLIALLVPHLQIAKEVEYRLASATQAQDALAASLDRFTDAAFVLDPAGVILQLNAAAHGMLSRTTEIRVRHGRMFFSDPRTNSAFCGALFCATRPLPRSTLIPLANATALNAEMLVSPLHARHELVAPWETPLALVIVTEPRRDAESIAHRARVLYGLTAAEARVMAAIALGAGVEEITQEFGVREPTVRAQLRSIFGKTGVNRQSDLVRLALAGASVVSDSGS